MLFARGLGALAARSSHPAAGASLQLWGEVLSIGVYGVAASFLVHVRHSQAHSALASHLYDIGAEVPSVVSHTMAWLHLVCLMCGRLRRIHVESTSGRFSQHVANCSAWRLHT